MSSEKRLTTVEDLLTLKSVSDAQVSPDGRLVAFVVGDSYKEKDAKTIKSQVWLVEAPGGEARPFTSGPRSDILPRWSPDGRTLAFLSDRVEEDRYQIYLLPAAGGEARPLTEVKGSVSAFSWSPDGRSIAYLMNDPETEEEKKREEEKDDAIEFEARPKYSRLWVVDVASSETHAVTPGPIQVWEFNWSADGNHFALLVSDSPEEWAWYRARLARVPAAGGQPITIYTTHKQLARPLWSPDGHEIAFISCIWSDRGVVAGDIYVIPAEGGEARNLTEDRPISATWMDWEGDGRSLLVMAYEDGETGLYRLERATNELRQLWREPVGVTDRWWQQYSRSADGQTLAVVREDAAYPRDVWLGRLGAGERVAWHQLTHLHPQVAELALGETEVLRWHGPDGLAIQGLLIKPVSYEPGRRYPLVTYVHGGPAALWGHRFYLSPGWPQLLAAHGFAVLLPNPRGSVGWGAAFTTANQGDLGGHDWQDILAGVNACIAAGIADPERLGICGWSYGGFMTAWAVTRTDRFKAAVMGAGISDWLSFHGTSNLPTWDAQAYQADPYDPEGPFVRFSPITYVHQVKTPTLILHGEKDPYVPVGQAYQFFRALKELGVPVELVIYPREGHGILEKAHVRDQLERIVAWFEKML